jgi:hypothetical protein
MKKLFFIMTLLVVKVSLFANDGDYAVSNIPPALLKNAHVVKRMEEQRFEISSLTRTRLYEKFALTILDENGDDYAILLRRYDKLRSIQSIEGRLYDANGKKIKSLKKGDVEDRSGVSGESLMEDARIKIHSFYYKVYPYTIEYEVETSFNNTYMFPDWIPQQAENYAVEESACIVVCPSEFAFSYKSFNYSGEPMIKQEKDTKTYSWEIKNLPPVVNEFASPDWQTITTCVFFRPDRFQIEGYAGAMTSWKSIGEFQYQLNKGRDQLPDNIKKQVHQLSDGIADPKEKVKVLYEYMQKNTRYISIQLGIGGLQPFDANYVATKSYGDCKALSNYMYSLLKEANIKSCYTQIRAGRGEKFFMPDFPSDQFDHIILCVPLQKDTMWLECTEQTLPAGYLGDFTEDRYALAVDEDGGKLVHTPKYGMNENVQVRNIKAKLDEDGSLNSMVFTKYTGLQQDGVHGIINHLSKDKVKEYLNDELDFATYDVNKFDYKETKSWSPAIEETLDVYVSNYATITGKRLFINPNVMNRSQRKLKEQEERKYDIQLSNSYKDIDSVEIEIPKGYAPESVPQAVNIETEFGKYYSNIKLVDNKILFYRTREQYSGTFPAKDYAGLVKYYDSIYKADRNKIVLIKKETN